VGLVAAAHRAAVRRRWFRRAIFFAGVKTPWQNDGMKLIRLPSLPLLLAAVWLACVPGAVVPAQAVDAAKTKQLFREPPREYSTGPLWVWNDMLTEQQIRDTLHDLAGQQVKQVWVHPRPGLMTPYLSADWFRLWRVTLQEAHKLDMNVWIYDENSYPSGFAGGFVPELMPQSRGRGLSLREAKGAPTWATNSVAVYQMSESGFENVTAKVKSGETLPEGDYLVGSEVRSGNSPWHGDRCYVNLLSPGVTEKFLEITMEAYRREIGKEFGKRVPGVFTDEPNIRPAAGLPWSEILVAEFQKRWGYNLLDHLPSLTKTVGDWRKVRHNYYAVLNEQFIEHWARPYHDYCATNQLEWTGHYWDHEWPNCSGVPDNMAMYAWHQRPSIDCLMNQYSEQTHGQFGNLRMPREVSSVANQLGMRRTLCEIYGAGGWDLRFEDMKRIGDWLSVLGVNTLNQHLSYVTLRGARKRDHPQSFSYHDPWWPAYHVSADYLARLSVALSQGEQVNPVLVLEPTTTAWMYQGEVKSLSPLGSKFFSFLRDLEANQVEYDLVSEDVLARHGSVASGLRVGQRTYQKVVVPEGTENLDTKTAQLLRDYMAAGGTVLGCGEPPTRVDGVISPQTQALASAPQWRRVEASSVAAQLGSPDLLIKRAQDDKGILFHHRRHIDDGEILFLVNTSIESVSVGTFESELNGVEAWDLYTGKVQPYPFERLGRGVRASFRLPPSGSLLLFLSRKPLRPAPASPETETVITAQTSPTIRRLEPNVMTIDFVDITAGGETRSAIYTYQANQFAWKQNGMPRNPWDSAVQYKDELITKTFPAGSGFEASYHFTLEGAVPPGISIVIERTDLYTITCNGQPVKARPNDWWLDKAFGRIDLAGAAKVGENVVTIKATPFTMFHELEPAYLLGDFALRPTEKGFVVGPATPLSVSEQGWKAQGCPFYSAGVAYQEEFTVPKKAGRYTIALAKWRGGVAKVTVNGKLAGYVDAPPWECDATKLIRRGANTVEVTVIGTLKNTLGPHHRNPALGAAWPGSFHQGPASGPPPGDQYSTVAYGLFEPFVLKQFTAP